MTTTAILDIGPVIDSIEPELLYFDLNAIDTREAFYLSDVLPDCVGLDSIDAREAYYLSDPLSNASDLDASDVKEVFYLSNPLPDLPELDAIDVRETLFDPLSFRVSNEERYRASVIVVQVVHEHSLHGIRQQLPEIETVHGPKKQHGHQDNQSKKTLL